MLTVAMVLLTSLMLGWLLLLHRRLNLESDQRRQLAIAFRQSRIERRAPRPGPPGARSLRLYREHLLATTQQHR